MSARRTRLVDCDPRWVVTTGSSEHSGVSFACPEGHESCRHVIPFTPTLEGRTTTGWQQNGAVWQWTGDTFETLSLSPSIRRIPRHASRAAALADGCIAEYITDSLFCAFHGFVTNGGIEFCGDSR